MHNGYTNLINILYLIDLFFGILTFVNIRVNIPRQSIYGTALIEQTDKAFDLHLIFRHKQVHLPQIFFIAYSSYAQRLWSAHNVSDMYLRTCIISLFADLISVDAVNNNSSLLTDDTAYRWVSGQKECIYLF